MKTNGKRLFAAQAQKAADDINAFFAVPVGHGVGIFKGGHLFPGAVLVLDIAERGLITVDLAKIMQKGNDGDGFRARCKAVDLLDALPRKIIAKAFIDID